MRDHIFVVAASSTISFACQRTIPFSMPCCVCNCDHGVCHITEIAWLSTETTAILIKHNSPLRRVKNLSLDTAQRITASFTWTCSMSEQAIDPLEGIFQGKPYCRNLRAAKLLSPQNLGLIVSGWGFEEVQDTKGGRLQAASHRCYAKQVRWSSTDEIKAMMSTTHSYYKGEICWPASFPSMENVSHHMYSNEHTSTHAFSTTI